MDIVERHFPIDTIKGIVGVTRSMASVSSRLNALLIEWIAASIPPSSPEHV